MILIHYFLSINLFSLLCEIIQLKTCEYTSYSYLTSTKTLYCCFLVGTSFFPKIWRFTCSLSSISYNIENKKFLLKSYSSPGVPTKQKTLYELNELCA